MINLYVDDVRTPPDFFIPARNYEDAIHILQWNEVAILSLDHDLGEERSGYDVCKFMVENNIWTHRIYLHTANPVGRENMYQLLNRYKRDYVRIYYGPMMPQGDY